MSPGIEFLTIDDVIAIHAKQIKRFGGASGLRDRALLESAVAAPQATFGGEHLHSDLFEMAAAYAFHISQNHPFFDGNKRTGLLAALVFLDLNGISINVPTLDLYNTMVDVAAGRMNKGNLAVFLRQLAKHHS